MFRVMTLRVAHSVEVEAEMLILNIYSFKYMERNYS
jgi:hypothetical protein